MNYISVRFSERPLFREVFIMLVMVCSCLLLRNTTGDLIGEAMGIGAVFSHRIFGALMQSRGKRLGNARWALYNSVSFLVFAFIVATMPNQILLASAFMGLFTAAAYSALAYFMTSRLERGNA